VPEPVPLPVPEVAGSAGVRRGNGDEYGQGQGHGHVYGRRWSRGLTLIEIMVVLAIIAIVSGIAVAGSMQAPLANLKGSATTIASAVKFAYTQATATSSDMRLVMDLDTQKIWIETSDRPMLAQSKDKTGTGGADPVTQVEQQALEEGAKILKGPPIPKPRFKPIPSAGFSESDESKGGKSLKRRIVFRSVQTTHDDAPRTSGRAYLYFWPGGHTERASIQIQVKDESSDEYTMTLLVSSPLTGKVTVKNGPVELQIPTDDDQASDRQDTGY
jgi:general secretion pathway protein H